MKQLRLPGGGNSLLLGVILVVVLSLAIAGCGGSSGGSGGTDPPLSSHPFEGTWNGSLSAINPTILIVANDGYDNANANLFRCDFVVDENGFVSGRFTFEGNFVTSGNHSVTGGATTGQVDNMGNISGLINLDVVCHVSPIAFTGNLSTNNFSVQFSIDGRTFNVPVVKS